MATEFKAMTEVLSFSKFFSYFFPQSKSSTQ